MFLIEPRPHEIDDRDVMPRLTARTEAVAEHEAERGFEHRFIGLLQTRLFIERENLVGGREFLVGAGREAVDLGQSTVCGLSLLRGLVESGGRRLV
jgi:hypothetical protein